MMHPEQVAKTSYVGRCLKDQGGPVIAATDYLKLYADQVRGHVPAPYLVLGTDGYGRSDTRARFEKVL